MSGHPPLRSAVWAAAAAIIVLALGACSSATTSSTSASAVASIGPNGHKPTLSGAGSTFDAPFFAAAFARYQHARRPGLRRCQRLRPPPGPGPAACPHHAPADH